MGPNPMTGVLIKREFWTLTCTQGEQHVNMKAEIRVILLPAKVQ